MGLQVLRSVVVHHQRLGVDGPEVWVQDGVWARRFQLDLMGALLRGSLMCLVNDLLVLRMVLVDTADVLQIVHWVHSLLLRRAGF